MPALPTWNKNFGQFSVGLRKTDLERELVNAREYTWLAGISPLFEIQNSKPWSC